MRKLAILLVSALVLAGCASASEEVSAVDENQNSDPSQADDSATDDGADSETNGSESLDGDITDLPTTDPLPDLKADEYQTIETVEEAAIIAANTFERFDSDGIVETLRGQTGEVVLIHNPDQKDQYSAAWVDVQQDSAELIFNAREFTSAWPFLLFSEPASIENTYFGPQPGGFGLQFDDPSVGRSGYNYLTDGEYLLGAWWFLEPEDPSSVVLITYDYDVSQKWKDRLDRAVDDFLSEQPAE